MLTTIPSWQLGNSILWQKDGGIAINVGNVMARETHTLRRFTDVDPQGKNKYRLTKKNGKTTFTRGLFLNP